MVNLAPETLLNPDDMAFTGGYRYDLNEVLFRLTSNVDPRRDMLFTDGPLDVLDHAADRFAFGSKVGIDATRKSRPWDGYAREWPRDLVLPEEILDRVKRRWKEYGL